MKKTACWTNSLQGSGRTVTNDNDDDNDESKEGCEEESENANDAHAPAVPLVDDSGPSSSPHKISEAQKLAYGLACKRLIDWGRLQFLKKAGLNAELVLYCPPSITPENACLIAVDPRSPLPLLSAAQAEGEGGKG